MKASEFDGKFESGADILGGLNLDRARRPRQEQKRVNVDFPAWMVEELGREARHLGVTRQSIIKVWLSERLEQAATRTRSR